VLVRLAIDPLISFYGHDSQSIEHHQRDIYAPQSQQSAPRACPIYGRRDDRRLAFALPNVDLGAFVQDCQSQLYDNYTIFFGSDQDKKSFWSVPLKVQKAPLQFFIFLFLF